MTYEFPEVRPADWDPPGPATAWQLFENAFALVEKDVGSTTTLRLIAVLDERDPALPMQEMAAYLRHPPYVQRAWLSLSGDGVTDLRAFGFEVFDYEDLPVAIERLADTVSDEVSETTTVQWPLCPSERQHLLSLEVSDDRVMWKCQRHGQTWEVGKLTSAGD